MNVLRKSFKLLARGLKRMPKTKTLQKISSVLIYFIVLSLS